MAGRITSIGSPGLPAVLPIELSARLLTGAPTVVLRKGQGLFEIGTPADCCYWLNDGVLKVSVASDQGAERILALQGAGSFVGECPMIDGLPRSASVYALRDSSLVFVGRSAFLECLQASPSFYPYLLHAFVARLRSADEDVAAASFLSLKARVARALLRFAEHLGEPTAMPDQLAIRDLRQEDVAALADVARENVSRILSEWKKQNLIVREAPSMYVISKPGLEREAGATSRGSAFD